MNSSCRLILIVLTTLVLGVVLGVLIGYFGRSHGASPDGVNSDSQGKTPVVEGLRSLDLDLDIRKFINDEISADNIRSLSKKITSKPHLAGTDAEKETAEFIAAEFIKYGLDDVKLLPYNVVLSLPDVDDPSTVRLVARDGTTNYEAQVKEKRLIDSQGGDDDIVPPFNAFSASGKQKADLVYVNYGRQEDFDLIISSGINMRGVICIARYGKIFRGSKAKYAERYGCIGLILYSDPKDYSQQKNGVSYPNNWWMPDTGIQRGSVALDDDPLTPGYAGIEGTYFEKDKNNEDIIKENSLKILVHPIGFKDAKVFLEALGGNAVPQAWVGNLDIEYKFGGEFIDTYQKIEMSITTKTLIAKTHNVVGVIKGEVEPDRYVMIGNHYDAWVYGAVDPTTGLSSMMESARVLGQLRKNNGWKPRRTVLFLAWGAEEAGIIGSREFVENYMTKLNHRAIAYLNLDVGVEGNYSFKAKALPLLHHVIEDSTKRVENPVQAEIEAGRTTVYDTWQFKQPGISLLGSGSDYTHFITKLGVACADMRYTFDKRQNLSSYPLYHSAYETFYLVDKLMDPGFKLHQSVSRVLTHMIYSLTDSALLPFSVDKYGSLVKQHLDTITKQFEYVTTERHATEHKNLLEASAKFNKACKDFSKKLERLDYENVLELRMYNDVMLQLDRNFIDPLGLPGRKYTRNVLFAPSTSNMYQGSMFPGLTDAYSSLNMFDIRSHDHPAIIRTWNRILKQMSVTRLFLLSAADLLESVGTF